MSDDVKRQFEAELNPLLVKCEQALNTNDVANARRLSVDMVLLVSLYSQQLATNEIREVLNNPLATAIMKRLQSRRIN
jgi:hypothetical protein